MKPSDPLLLAEGTLHCGMYPAGKEPISRHLATPGFPQCDHTVGKLSGTLVHCVVKYSRPRDLKSSSNVSLPFAWITGPATDPSYFMIERGVFQTLWKNDNCIKYYSSHFDVYHDHKFFLLICHMNNCPLKKDRDRVKICWITPYRPSPYRVRFFKSGKNPNEPNLQHLSQ